MRIKKQKNTWLLPIGLFGIGYLIIKALQNDKAIQGIADFSCYTEGVNAIERKSKFVPVYKNLAMPELGWRAETNIKYAQGKCGVYLIKENGIITYIGAGTNVYKNALRHFEPSENRSGQRYDETLDTKNYTIRIVLTNTVKQAFQLEQALIRKYKPRDNEIQYEMILEFDKRPQEKILQEYEEAPF